MRLSLQNIKPICYQLGLLLFTIVILLSSCANYKKHIAGSEKAWKTEMLPPTNPAVEHTVFLVGDAGGSPMNESTAALQLLKEHLEEAGENSHVIFLGDNIYPVGMPPKHHEDRPLATHRLNAQLDILKNYKGKPLFIPGNHDWYDYGVKGVQRQEKFIEKHLNAGIEDEDDWDNYFYPDNACGGPDLIEVNENLVIILVDSNWFVIDWDKYPKINDGCPITSREEFERAYEALIRKHKSKNILVAMHHPLHSNGSHGGHYSFRDHIFPHKNIPLPVLGTLVNGLRATVGTRQDIAHSIYKRMHESLVHPATQGGEFIFAAGHDHNLQYFDYSDDPTDGQHYIVSGAGSKKTPVVGGNGSKFAYGNYGFSKLDYYKDGSVWMEFWSFEEESKAGKMVYRTKIKDALSKEVVEIPTEFPTYDSKVQVVTKKPILNPVDSVSKFHDVVLGKHYRDIYLTEFDFQTLDLASFKGGVEVVKKGGGLQTNSLRLQAPDGHQYVMRSFTKDATRGVSYPFNRMSFVGFILNDNFLASHPFGALAVPTLADACNVYHANPSVFYIPKQPILGVYNDIFGDEVYLVEERAGGKWPSLGSFGASDKKLISTIDVAAKIRKNHKHHIDQKWVARSRLFDLVIGDWDRHDDQWRWSSLEDEDGHHIYRPIPRDRDQAFSKYDGVLIPLLRPFNPLLKQLADYQEEITNMRWIANNTRHFDHGFLSEVTLEEWLEEARFIQSKLTDEVINEAFTHFPEKANALTGDRIKEVMRYRRDNLDDIARRFYEQISKKIAVVGTDKREFFEVIRQNDSITSVKVYALSKKGNRKELLYKRDIVNTDTREIYLFGLEDDDEFYLAGDVKKAARVRIIGGAGDDMVRDESRVRGLGKRTKVYDSIGNNEFSLGREASNKTSNIATRNFYDRKGTQYDENFSIPFPILGANADDGFLAGFVLARFESGFFKEPYARMQIFKGNYAFATNGLELGYLGEFIQTAGRWDVVVNANAQTGRYAFNFYGLGNESVQTTDDLDFNRVRQTQLYLDAGFQRRFAVNYGRFSVRPLVQYNDIESTANRFISSDDSGLDDSVFESTLHTGIKTALNYENVDDLVSPKNGMKFDAFYSYQFNVEDVDADFHNIGSSLTWYKSTGKRLPLTLATKFGVDYIDGDFPFYFAPTLGQQNSLRGFRPERFRGNTAFYHTTDLRWSVFSSQNVVLPFSMGVFGGFDYGRVWQNNDMSDQWHYSYGGGLWIAPLDFIILSFGLHHSDENDLFRFGVGHDF